MAMKVYINGDTVEIDKTGQPLLNIPRNKAIYRIENDEVTIFNNEDRTIYRQDDISSIQNQAGTAIGKLQDVVKYLSKSVVVRGTSVTRTTGGTGGTGEANTASNVGAGEGVFKQKVGVDLEFKSLVAGTGITLGSTADEITINSTTAALFGLFSQTAQGATVTNTTTETDILGTGVGSLTVPANFFKVGDAYHAKVGGTISAQNGDEITIRIKDGATVLATTGLISLQAVTALAWEIEIDFTIRTIGVSGQIFTNGNFAYNRNTGSLEGFVFSDVQKIDTTVINTLMVTAEWNQAKTQDIIFTDMTTLYKTY